MSPLACFLLFIVALTALVIAYLTKQFQEENLLYSRDSLLKNINSDPKIIEKEKVVAERLNGRIAMIGFVAAVGAYLTTGQIIPGIV